MNVSLNTYPLLQMSVCDGGFFMRKIISFYRFRIATAQSGENEGCGKGRLFSRIKVKWELYRTPCELPVNREETPRGQIVYVPIPAKWIGDDWLLYKFIETAFCELSGDYIYLEPAIQKKLCMSKAGRQLFEQTGLLQAEEELAVWWELFLSQRPVQASSLIVLCSCERFPQIRDLCFALGETRNEMNLILSGDESVAISEQLADFEEDLYYEYGLVLQTKMPEQERETERILVVDFETDPGLLMSLSGNHWKAPVTYLDCMPTPEKEKYGTCRNRVSFEYCSIGANWRWKGAATIDSTAKNVYNTMNENKIMKWAQCRKILDRKGNHYGRKEEHTDL